MCEQFKTLKPADTIFLVITDLDRAESFGSMWIQICNTALKVDESCEAFSA